MNFPAHADPSTAAAQRSPQSRPPHPTPSPAPGRCAHLASGRLLVLLFRERSFAGNFPALRGKLGGLLPAAGRQVRSSGRGARGAGAAWSPALALVSPPGWLRRRLGSSPLPLALRSRRGRRAPARPGGSASRFYLPSRAPPAPPPAAPPPPSAHPPDFLACPPAAPRPASRPRCGRGSSATQAWFRK